MERMTAGLVVLVSFSFSTSAQASSITFTSGAAFFFALFPGSGAAVVEGYQTVPPNTIIPDGTTINGLTYTAFSFGTDGRIASATFNSIGGQSLALERSGSADYFFRGDSFTVALPSPI